MRPGSPVFWLYKARTFSAKVSVMRFSRNSKKWIAGLMATCLALPLAGCSPESSTSTTNTKSTSYPGTPKPPKEQTGTSIGGSSADKGRESAEPNAADDAGTPADQKPNE